MKEELNIAAILKDKQNVELYDLLHNINVKLDNISTTNGTTNIWCKRDLPNKTQHFGYTELGTERGWLDGLQILKPSRAMRDWSKFAWKKGCILTNGEAMCAFDSWRTGSEYTQFKGMFMTGSYENAVCDTRDFTEVTNPDILCKYISDIKNALGGTLNLKTLEIEKPEFKDGDIVCNNEGIYIYNERLSDTLFSYHVCYVISRRRFILGGNQNLPGIKLATDIEKRLLFVSLKEIGKKWNAVTKTLEDFHKKCDFMPFQKVLVRDSNNEIWNASLFSRKEGNEYYIVSGEYFRQCIPYNEQTKHLLGTKDE